MSLHINKFIDRLKAAESRNQKDFFMSINDARDLHKDITKLLLIIQELREPNDLTVNSTVEIKGGDF